MRGGAGLRRYFEDRSGGLNNEIGINGYNDGIRTVNIMITGRRDFNVDDAVFIIDGPSEAA